MAVYSLVLFSQVFVSQRQAQAEKHYSIVFRSNSGLYSGKISGKMPAH
jgi:hypothetical protein